MQCPPCHRPMKMVDYMDTREALPLVWMTGWRCEHCGFAINPLGEFNRRFLEFDAYQRRQAAGVERTDTPLAVPQGRQAASAERC